MNLEEHFDDYLAALLRGERAFCADVARQALAGDVPIKRIYSDLFRESLYRVGELWQTNQISVATEHLATAITESIMGQVVAPALFDHEPTGRRMLVSCATNEFHQVGGRMVADIAEMSGWDTRFLGARTSPQELLKQIDDEKPDVLALSIAVYSNLPALCTQIEMVRQSWPDLPIWLGGQMFHWGGQELSDRYPRLTIYSSLDDLEVELDHFGSAGAEN